MGRFGRGGRAVMGWAATMLVTAAAAGAAHADEVWIGGYTHDSKFLGIAKGGMEHGNDIELGYRSNPLGGVFRYIFHPSAYAILSVNDVGDTSFVGGGFSWRLNFWRKFYFDPGVGLVVHDGHVRLPPANAPGLSPQEAEYRAYLYRRYIQFGSRVVFEPEFNFGYHITDRWAAEISYVHLSQAHIFGSPNQGMDDLGGRLVYRFGGP